MNAALTVKQHKSLEAVIGKKLTIVTYGYQNGGPGDGFAFNADVRNVPAGGEPDETGLMSKISKAVMNTGQAKAWLKKMELEWTPELKPGDKVSIGCSRGHHRSVAIAEAYAAWLRSRGWKVTVKHRDIKVAYK